MPDQLTVDKLLEGVPNIPGEGGLDAPQAQAPPKFSVDDLLQGIPGLSAGDVPQTTALGTAARAAVSGAAPGAAAAAAFAPTAEAVTTLAAPTGPFAPLIGIGAGAVAGGVAAWAASKAQHAIASTLAPQTTEKFNREEAAGEQQHPVAGAIGRLATMLPMFEFAPENTVGGLSALYKAARGVVLTDAEKLAAKTMASQVGLQTGLGVVQPLLFGESPTKQGIAEAFVQSLILGHPRYEIFGAPAAEAISKEEATADAANQKNLVQNPAQTYQAPPPPDLTPEQRGQLSDLAARMASGAPESADDAAHSALMAENENARKYFEQQKQGWAQAFAHNLAAQAWETGDSANRFSEVPPVAATPEAAKSPTEATPAAPTPKTAADVLSKPPGSTSHTDVAAMPDPEFNKLVGAKDASGNPIFRVSDDSVRYGMTQKPEIIPELERLRDEAQKRIPELVKNNDNQGFMAAMGKNQWFNNAIEGINKKGPNYDKVVADDVAAGATAKPAATPIVDQPVKNPAPSTVNPPSVTPLAVSNVPHGTPAEAEWTKHQGDPAELANRFQKTFESGDVAVSKGESGVGRKGATTFESLQGKSSKQAKEAVAQDVAASKDAGAQSRKMVAMLSPDKSHVIVGTASETKSGDVRTLKVSTYDIGAGRKSPGGEHFASGYDKMVADGWTPLASLKSDKPMKGVFATYSPEQWRFIESQLRESHAAAQRTTEAMMSHFEAAKDFGREDGKESAPAVNRPNFDQGHAEAIYDALTDHGDVKSPKDVVDALHGSFEAVGRLARDLGLDPVRDGAEKVAADLSQFIFEHYENISKEPTGTRAEKFWDAISGSIAEKVRPELEGQPGVQADVRGADAGPGGETAGGKPGGGGTQTRASADAEGGVGGAAKPDTTNAAGSDASGIKTETGKVELPPGSKFNPARMERPHDIVDEIEGSMGTIRNKKNAKPGTEGYYGEGYKQAQRAFPKMFSDTGSTPDEITDGLRRSGHFGEDATVDDLWDSMLSARKSRTAIARGELPEQKTDRFYAAMQDNLAKKGTHKLSVGELSVGDKFTLKGENVEVTGIDPDTGEVTVKDGRKFGSQTIPDGADIAIDQGSLKQSARLAPDEDPFALNRPESVEDQKARLAQEDAAKTKADQKSAAVEGAAKPLIGSTGDIGQRDMLGGGDLFSQENVRNRTRQAKEEVDNLRPGDAHTARTLETIERNLTGLGIKVRRIIDPLVGHFSTGEYKELMNGRGNAERVITYTIADSIKPSGDAYVALTHEVEHAIFAKETPERQAAGMRAVRAMTNEQLGIGNFKEQIPQGLPENAGEAVQQEGRLAEHLGRKLQAEGFDPAAAATLSQRFVRLLKDVYNGALMALAKVAGYPISRERALAYFENRLKMVLAGDMSTMSWLNFLGGPRMKMPDWDNPNVAGLQRFRSPDPVNNPKKYLETKDGAPVGIAALNEFLSPLKEAAHEWAVSKGNIAGMTDDQIMQRYVSLPDKVGDSDVFTNGATPGSLIDQAAKQYGVSPETKFSDLPNDVAKQRAAVVTHGLLAATKAEMASAATDARIQWGRDARELDRNTKSLVRLTKDYVDLDYMAKTARDAMVGLLNDVRTAVRGVRDSSFRQGEVEQTLSQLDPASQVNGQITKPYRAALDRLQARLSGEVTGSFGDALQTVGSMDIDWSKKPHEIANQILAKHTENPEGNRDLRPFLEDGPDGRALMSTLIAYGKGNTHMMDMLAMRAERAGDDRAKANEILKEAVGLGRSALGELKERIDATFGKNMRMRDRMLRVADKIADLSDKNHDLLDSIARNKSVVDFHEDVFKPIVERDMARIEQQAGISLKNFEVVHDAEVPVPAKPDAGPDGFVTKQLKLRTGLGKRGDLPTPSEEVIGWQRSIQKWLDNPENLKYGAKYNEMADVANKLKNHFIANEHLNIKTNAVERWLAPIQDRCRAAGTEAARLAGLAFNQFSSFARGKREFAVQNGTEFSAQLSRAKKLLGHGSTDNVTFWNHIIGTELHNLQDRPDIWATAKTEKEMIDRSVSAVTDALNPKTQEARDAVAKLIRIHAENSTGLRRNGEDLGLKVQDMGGAPNSNILRPALGVAPLVLPRATTAQAVDFFHEHLARSWTKDQMKPDVIAKMYDADPNQLRASLQDKFTKPVWDWFVKSLAYDQKPKFSAPMENGIYPLADRENIVKAYDGAHGDPVKFAELLSELHDRPADGAFVADTLDTMQQYGNLLRTMAGDEAEAVTKGSPNPPRFIVDARHWEAAPKEWWDYLMTDQNTMLRVINGQAHQAAFGRNGMQQEANLTMAVNEQREFYTKLRAWRDELQKANPGIQEKQLQGLMKARAEKEGVSWDAVKNSKTNLDSLTSVAQHYDAMKSMNNSGKIPELLPWLRVLHTIAGGTVSGAGTAITAHSVFLEQPARHLGFGPRSLAMTARSVRDLAGTMANSLLQAFGHEVVFEARRTLDANDGGIYDPINSNRDRYTVAYEHAHAAYRDASKVSRMAGTAADVAGAALQHDVWAPGAREKALARQAAGEPVAPSFKALSPFHWMAKCLEISNFITWQRHIEGMIAGGVKHLELHPELVEDNSFRFTPKTLNGFNPGDREFNFLTDRLGQYGVSIEQLVRDAYKNQGTGEPMLSPEMRKNIQQVVLNEITLESSLTSRMPSLQTGGLGTAMNPFLGWPLQKTYQVMRGFREPDGTKLASSFRNGLTPYLAILPLGMAAAWLRNKFDEDVLGRKQNISDISQIHDVKSGLMTALDNASRVGTFGLLGEGANYFLSNDNVRPLSVDSRVFFVNTLLSTGNSVRTLYQQTAPQIAAGNFEGAEKTATDYQTVWRPIIQQLGGNGLLQNLGAVNHLLALDDTEARISNRISVNNYLRVAGRELNLDVRTFNGMMSDQSVPGPIKPFVGQMVLAAYANNSQDFNSAMRDAVRQAKAEGMTAEQAMKKVVTMYEAQNPVSIVFKAKPTEGEYRKLLAQLPDQGKQSVTQAIALYQHFGSQIGATTPTFAKDKVVKPVVFDSGASSVLDRMRGQRQTAGAF